MVAAAGPGPGSNSAPGRQEPVVMMERSAIYIPEFIKNLANTRLLIKIFFVL
jgi:hypothetical protein